MMGDCTVNAFQTKDIIIMGMIKKEDAMCLHNVKWKVGCGFS